MQCIFLTRVQICIQVMQACGLIINIDIILLQTIGKIHFIIKNLPI